MLDTDLFLFSDIRGLWNEFEHFGPREYIGVAVEQAPTYQEARALGGLNFNGGVQLLALQKMRASAEYAALMKRYAERRWTHMKPGGIGWLGDQTLYSWMSVNGSGAQHIFHVLPCGWNRQIGTHMAGWKGFWAAHACDAPCHLLHGNFRRAQALHGEPEARQQRRHLPQGRRRPPRARPPLPQRHARRAHARHGAANVLP